ncbi:MAG: hypothetical protein DRQ43_00375 [Gammaproteobacteria bacterium]|nr:MAG: hypothetical protein DRQ43_00375 [Gammaproteobacteria bacterium]
MNMNNLLKSTEDFLNQLSLRERILVLLGILSVLYMIWDTFLLIPVQHSHKQLTAEHLSIQKQLSDLEVRNILAAGLLQNNNKDKFNKKIDQVKGKINDLDQTLKKRLQGRVPDELMSSMLNDVLKKNQGLQLLFIHNLPAEPLIQKELAKEVNKERIKEDNPGIFMHSLEIELMGSYLDILDYLIALESMQWKIFWDQVQLNVLEYPKVKVHIKVHTFSLTEGWLSV